MFTFYLPLPFFLLSRWLLLLALWLLTQGCFLIANYDLFYQVSFAEVIRGMIGSFRFAMSGTLFILAPFLILNLLPLHYKHNRYYQGFADLWYYAAALLFFIANGVDISYYPITHQRMSGTIFTYLGGMKSDFLRLLPSFLVRYWYLTLLAILGIFILFFVGKRLKLQAPKSVNIRYYIKQIVALLVFTPLIVLGQRGGLQPQPLDIFHAGQYTSNNADAILNTPFVIMKTLNRQEIQEISYYTSEEALYAQFDPHHAYKNPIFQGDKLPNIVILILEGFSAEYSKYLSGGDIGYTPFIDSLAQQGIAYRGFSNSLVSMTGIPAIVAGFPNWMEEKYIVSRYSPNNLPSLPNTLKTLGYTSSFYHGGFNGTMGFDAFCAKIGFDEYVGKTEYNNDKDFDGDWGIFDEPFMQFAAHRLKQETSTTPFFSVVYTLTSHDPFIIPKAYTNRFPKGTLPSHEAVGYTDYALRRFFETCSNKDWFENTLFIITSDHSSFVENEYYTSSLGAMEIPMIWYFPKQISPQKTSEIMQQIDLMPSLLHYVGYAEPFIAFGQSMFDTTVTPYTMRLSNGDYQFVENGWVLNFIDGKSISLKKDQRDFAKLSNQMQHYPDTLQILENRVKALTQQYNSRVVRNQFMNISH